MDKGLSVEMMTVGEVAIAKDGQRRQGHAHDRDSGHQSGDPQIHSCLLQSKVHPETQHIKSKWDGHSGSRM